MSDSQTAAMLPGLDLIFGAEALQPPLTGIGRYSMELAGRLEQSAEIARLRYFSLGQWCESPLPRLRQLNAPTAPGAGEAAPQTALWLRLRRQLAGSRLAVRAYHLASQPINTWQLRGNRNSLFHSPGFFVPDFPGRTVATVHDLSHIRYPRFHPAARVDLLNMALPRSLARADHIITISEATRAELLALFPACTAQQVSTTLLAADPVFHPRSAGEIDAGLQRLAAHLQQGRAPGSLPALRPQGYTLYVGTIEPRKNIDRLLSAYEMLPAGLRTAFPLLVAGARGWHSEQTHARLERAQQQGWLLYLSFVPQQLLPLLYAGAAVLAYASLYEGFGLPVVEAMASGTPVVTSDTSSMPEVAGGAALLVDPLDTEALAAAIGQALSDQQWRAEARARGLRRAAELSWERCAAETLAVYRKAMQ